MGLDRPVPRLLKKLAARLPSRWQQELKRRRFARQIRQGKFQSDEPEYHRLSSLVAPGDWALDIGANIGHYTLRLSDLVGPRGRVLGFEPVPLTFELLAANAALARHQNISLFNAAASEQTGIAGIAIPTFAETGLENFYMAQVVGDAGADLRILCLGIDALRLPRISLMKIDAEGHELAIIRGMTDTLRKYRPILIVEDNDPAVPEALKEMGYRSEKAAGSDNRVFHPE